MEKQPENAGIIVVLWLGQKILSRMGGFVLKFWKRANLVAHLFNGTVGTAEKRIVISRDSWSVNPAIDGARFE